MEHSSNHLNTLIKLSNISVVFSNVLLMLCQKQKDIGYVMRLYYRIICLEHLEKENELNDCINEMVEFNDQIHYVKEIKDKYKK